MEPPSPNAKNTGEHKSLSESPIPKHPMVHPTQNKGHATREAGSTESGKGEQLGNGKPEVLRQWEEEKKHTDEEKKHKRKNTQNLGSNPCATTWQQQVTQNQSFFTC